MPRLNISTATGPMLTLDGRPVISFGGCNYLGLSYHPDVQAALIRALSRLGISTSASRETTGNTTAHDELEASLRGFLRAPAAVVVPDGYTANLAAAQALAATHSTAIIDDRCHRSIREAIVCSGMKLFEYRHLDAHDAAAQLASHPSSTLWTDGVFASDGAVAPIPDLLAAARRANATLVLDDCHGFCTLGDGGRGTLSHYNLHESLPPDVVITTTLAKGLGCHGGVIVGTPALENLIRSRSIAYICTTPTSPAIAAAAVEALAIIDHDPSRLARLIRNSDHLARALRSSGLKISTSPAPIFAFTLPSPEDMQPLAASLLESGFLAPLIDYPDGPAREYFRLSITSEHTPNQIDGLATAIRSHLARAETSSAPAQGDLRSMESAAHSRPV